MTKQNLKLVTVGLILGAMLALMAATPEAPRKDMRDPVVLGHRITPLGDSQLVYAKP